MRHRRPLKNCAGKAFFPECDRELLPIFGFQLLGRDVASDGSSPVAGRAIPCGNRQSFCDPEQGRLLYEERIIGKWLAMLKEIAPTSRAPLSSWATTSNFQRYVPHWKRTFESKYQECND
jgi:hypothetical protein